MKGKNEAESHGNKNVLGNGAHSAKVGGLRRPSMPESVLCSFLFGVF